MNDQHLTPVEKRYLDAVLDRLRDLENTDRGMFAEVLIAESLSGREAGPVVGTVRRRVELRAHPGQVLR